MTKSEIEWTDRVWNIVRGCSRISEGCRNCYAERQAHRHSGPGRPYEGLTVIRDGRPGWSGEVRFIRDKLFQPLAWKKPSRVFVNSMSDLFHERLPYSQIAQAFSVMMAAPQHTFQVLTKRPHIALRFFEWLKEYRGGPAMALRARFLSAWGDRKADPPPLSKAWPLPNVWLGVSVEDQAAADARLPLLGKMPAAVRWVSAEPLLGPVRFWHCQKPAPKLDWVVVGGESGPLARPFSLEWLDSIEGQCALHDVPLFSKQLGAKPVWGDDDLPVVLKSRKGGDPKEWPLAYPREWPTL